MEETGIIPLQKHLSNPITTLSEKIIVEVMEPLSEHDYYYHHRRRRYEEPPYFLVGLGFLMVAWGVLSYLRIVEGSAWIGFAGAILILLAISIALTRRSTAKTVLGTLSSHEGETVKLSKLADELEMSERELRSAIVDLRSEGKLKVAFDKNTGELMIGEPKQTARTQRVSVFCPYCSFPLPPGAHFCPSCGSSLE